jgi:formylglycine-generating enzyme required for sulfatase activity
VKHGPHSSANGLVGRADLLRLLATAPGAALLLDDDGEHQFGYWQQDTPNEHDQTSDTIVDPPPEKPPVQTGNFKLPLQMPFVHVIAERQAREPRNQQQNPVQTVAVYDPISEDDAKPPSAVRLVNYQDLVPKARLMPALKRYTSSDRTAGLDVPLLVKQIAGQQLPRHLPRRQLKTWHSHWVVVVDFAKRLWPYRQDMHRLAEDLLHACGQSGVSIRIINHGPLQHWTDWVEEQRTSGALPTKHAWRMPPAGTPVLLVSDLGLLEGPDSTSYQAWQRFIRQLGKAQTRPLALVPLGAEQFDGGLPSNLILLRWSPDARIRPERALGGGKVDPDGIKDLLAMAAVTRRVDPPLLRAMRRLNPKAPLNAGLEGAFWCHADVEAGSAANIHYEAQAKHLAYFAQQLDDCHIELEQLRYSHHAHLRAVLSHEETLLWGAHAKLDGAEAAAEAYQRLEKADVFMRQLAATLKQSDGLQKGGIWWSVAQDIVQRADNLMGERYKHLFTPLAAAIAKACGDWRQLPDWVDPADLVEQDKRKTQPCWLVRDPVTGSINLQPTSPARNQSALTGPLPIDQGGFRIESAGSKMVLSIQNLPYRLCGLQEETLIKLTTSQETLMLATVKRPRGVMAWGCDKAGLWLRTQAFSGKDWHWQTADLKISHTKHDNQSFRLGVVPFRDLKRKLESRKDHELIHGQILQDDQNFSIVDFKLDDYGALANLTIMTEAGSVEQSFRWIEPGTFWMGSPDDDLERSGGEGPRHEVTISRGFWLADTACTQALWQAVMGDNPSHFKDDPQQPVEQVSWLHVQNFLRELEKLLPGCRADLPTEAEWEYACRAGTTTPFSFGPQITPEQANYDGNYPYAGGEQGEFRQKTVAVKSLPANPWGLYEMHGNVWEWCKDGQRTYDEQAQIDPVGPMRHGEDEPRSVRGGSWSGNARGSRSAFRYAFPAGLAFSDLSFRFCLKSIEPGQETGVPGGTPGLATGDSPKSVEEDKSPEQSF